MAEGMCIVYSASITPKEFVDGEAYYYFHFQSIFAYSSIKNLAEGCGWNSFTSVIIKNLSLRTY